MSKLKINLFGECWKLKKISGSVEQMLSWENISLKMNQPLIEALIDPFFYHLLNDEKIKSIDDIPGEISEGMLNTYKNQIEIWYKNKKVQKLKIDDLKPELLLFPLYNIKLNKATNKENGIYIIEKGIGMVGSYETNITDFFIENLEFILLEANGITVLQNFKYQDQLLTFKKKDILITYQNGYELK